MNFRPKQYYVPAASSVPTAPKKEGINVYYRKDDGKLGHFAWNPDEEHKEPHKEAILTVREALVAEGDGLENKAVLAVIKGGKQNDN